MLRGRYSISFAMIWPMLTAGLLAGIVAEQRTHIRPNDADPYHLRARAGVEKVPYVVGYWTGKDEDIPPAAQKLLKPNAILSRTYTENAGGRAHRGGAEASLLIVQCRDSRDMVGHYPPICYCAHGMSEDSRRERDWKIGNKVIKGMEYRFSQLTHGELRRTTVYNFFCVPGGGIVRDITGVEAAAEDYQQRHYGAAQFQVVFGTWESSELSADERDAAFATLIGPNLSLIETLTFGGLP